MVPLSFLLAQRLSVQIQLYITVLKRPHDQTEFSFLLAYFNIAKCKDTLENPLFEASVDQGIQSVYSLSQHINISTGLSEDSIEIHNLLFEL